MPSTLGEFIEEQHTVVGPRHLARHGYLSPTDQAHSREGMMRGAKRPRRDQGSAVAGVAGDAVEAGGVEGLRQGHVSPDYDHAG
jgi:hypothetical protein